MKKFSKSKRSTWRYFWAHWCAFQMVAITLGIWKFKYLFHDWYKPWMKMLGFSYDDIQKFHKTHSNHHLEYLDNHDLKEFDWDAMIIDNECSQYTKESCTRNAYEEMLYIIENNNKPHIKHVVEMYMKPRLFELGLYETKKDV